MIVDKTNLIIRRPTQKDVEFLAENIRHDDLVEVRAISNKTIQECVVELPDIDKNAWVWEYDGKVMCVFGVNPIEGMKGVGAIWMLATKFFDDHLMIFATACKPIVNDLISPFEYIFNYVHVENKKSIKWLKWLGFVVREAEPIGVNNAKFHYFEMWNDKCVIQ